MNETGRSVWLHTRGTGWDYTWFTSTGKEPAFPGGSSRVLRCLSAGQSTATRTTLAYCDRSALTVATGGFSTRRDKHGRRIQEHVLVAERGFPLPRAGRAEVIAAAISSFEIKTALQGFDGQASTQAFESEVTRLIAAYEQPRARVLEHPTLDTPTLNTIIDQKALLCVEPQIPFAELWRMVYRADDIPVVGFLVAAGIVDPTAFVGFPALLSADKPMYQWGATAGQYVVFGTDGRPAAIAEADLRRRVTEKRSLTSDEQFVHVKNSGRNYFRRGLRK